MFGAHIVVVKAVRLLASEGEDLLRTWGEIIHGIEINPNRLEVQFAHGGLSHPFELFPQEIGSESVALFRAQLFLGSLLEMGGLGGDEESVQLRLDGRGKEGEIGREAEQTEKVEGFLGGDRVGVKDDSVGATHLIAQHAGFFLNQFLAGVIFQLRQLADHFDQAIQNLPLRFAQGCLVGNLEKISKSFGSFAIQPADGEAELINRFDDLVDLLAQNEAGEVEHGGGAHAGSDIGGAGGEITEGGGKRELELIFEGGVQLIGRFPRFEKLEARAQGLQPNMILLIDHDGKGFVPIDDQAAAGIFGGMLSADEMFFDQELFIQRGEGFHGHGNFGGTHGGEVGHRGLDCFQEFQSIRLFEPTWKGKMFHIPSEANPTGDDDARIGFRGRGGGGVTVFRFHGE